MLSPATHSALGRLVSSITYLLEFICQRDHINVFRVLHYTFSAYHNFYYLFYLSLNLCMRIYGPKPLYRITQPHSTETGNAVCSGYQF